VTNDYGDLAYVFREECGCLAIMTTRAQSIRDEADDIIDVLAGGGTAEKMPIEAARQTPTWCSAHKPSAEAVAS